MTNKEVIIVCNGCKDGSYEYAKSLGEPFKPIYWHKALGYPRAVNIGISLSEMEYVLLWNNDNVVLDFAAPNWTDIMEQPFKDNPNVAITGLNKCWRGGWEWFPFFCVMIRRNIFNTVGWLDEAFSPGAGEDTDWCVRAGKAGFDLQEVGVMPLWHPSGDHSTMSSLPDRDAIYERNEKLLQSRYGLGTHHPTEKTC